MRGELTDRRLIELYDFWAARRADGEPIPRRTAMDPARLAPWKDNLLLMGASDGSYRYRLYGHAFVEEFGVEMRGRTIDDLPLDQAEALRAEYDGVRESGAPAARRHTARFPMFPDDPAIDAEHEVTWERLVLPLSEDGRTLSALLVAAYPIDPE